MTLQRKRFESVNTQGCFYNDWSSFTVIQSDISGLLQIREKFKGIVHPKILPDPSLFTTDIWEVQRSLMYFQNLWLLQAGMMDRGGAHYNLDSQQCLELAE